MILSTIDILDNYNDFQAQIQAALSATDSASETIAKIIGDVDTGNATLNSEHRIGNLKKALMSITDSSTVRSSWIALLKSAECKKAVMTWQSDELFVKFLMSQFQSQNKSVV